MLTLANGKQLTVTANNPRKNIYIDKVELNGKAIDVNYITYAQLMEGGELRFTLTDTPNTPTPDAARRPRLPPIRTPTRPPSPSPMWTRI